MPPWITSSAPHETSISRSPVTVASRLRKRMDDAFSAVWVKADNLSVSLRRAAFALALERVAEAIATRGLFP